MFFFKHKNYLFVFFLMLPFLVAFAARYNTVDGIMDLISSVSPQWKNLLNPKVDEFWREGNHVPDAGFLILAKNPTIENAKLWLLRNEIKAKQLEIMLPLVEQAQRELVHQGLIKDRYNTVKRERAGPLPVSPISNLKMASSIEYFFLFSPTCSHCRQMASNIRTLPNITPLQVTKDKLHHWPGMPLSQYATSDTVRSYLKGGQVPVLIILDRSSNNVQILRGTQTTESVLLATANLIDPRGKK